MKIETGHPIPDDLPVQKGRQPKYPWRKMKVGESFFIEGEGKRGRAYMAGMKFAQREKAKGLSFRIGAAEEPNGVRIWRVE